MTRLSPGEVEQFLYREAELLDSWRLEEWLGWFLPDATYEVPPTDAPDADPKQHLFIIADTIQVLRGRVKRLLSPHAHAESPHSRTRRLIANVRVLEEDGDGARIGANFMVHRFKHAQHDTFVGRYLHRVERDAGGRLRFRQRRAVLDNEALRPSGKISFIL